MAEPSTDIVVVGAGAFGLTTALRLARAGLRVRVVDRRSNGAPNASAVAAGMLAPVSETLAEGGDGEHLRRLLAARDLWPDFAQSVRGLSLDRTGTDLLAAGDDAVEAVIAQLLGWGIQSSRLSAPRLGVHLQDDWRLDSTTAIAALRAALQALGVGIEAGDVGAGAGGEGGLGGLRLDGEPLRAGGVVIAAGYGGHGLATAAPELSVLSPIKGQLVAFAPSLLGGPTLRGEGLYLAPQGSGARAGATMEPGRDDTALDPAVVDRLQRGAVALQPALLGLTHHGEAGVRAATPDGWPLVGPSATPGVFLATGARRNGWLLAPLVSQMLADQITGGAPHPQVGGMGQAFHPGRFTR